jgi:hypothetical protein
MTLRYRKCLIYMRKCLRFIFYSTIKENRRREKYVGCCNRKQEKGWHGGDLEYENRRGLGQEPRKGSVPYALKLEILKCADNCIWKVEYICGK